MQRKPFGQTRDGQAVEAITLDNGQLSCTFLTYGATLVSLNVPDPAGKMVDVALGYDTLEAYESQDKYLGATVGRYANRIAAGRFTLDGVEYTLAVNDGDNHLHGGPTGFSTGCGKLRRCRAVCASPTRARTWRRASPAPLPPR